MLFCFQILQTNHKISGIGAEFNILYLHSWLNLFRFFFFFLLFFPPVMLPLIYIPIFLIFS